MPVPTHGSTEAKVLPQFDKDIRDLHLIYDYDAHDSNGKPEKWRYEMCLSQPDVHIFQAIEADDGAKGGSSQKSESCIKYTAVPWLGA
jgi:hypothetical protein